MKSRVSKYYINKKIPWSEWVNVQKSHDLYYLHERKEVFKYSKLNIVSFYYSSVKWLECKWNLGHWCFTVQFCKIYMYMNPGTGKIYHIYYKYSDMLGGIDALLGVVTLSKLLCPPSEKGSPK